MDTIRRLKKIVAGTLASGGLALAAVGLATGVAQADNLDWGPAHHWCPGQALPPTGNHVTDPFRGWDMSVCHTYYYL